MLIGAASCQVASCRAAGPAAWGLSSWTAGIAAVFPPFVYRRQLSFPCYPDCMLRARWQHIVHILVQTHSVGKACQFGQSSSVQQQESSEMRACIKPLLQTRPTCNNNTANKWDAPRVQTCAGGPHAHTATEPRTQQHSCSCNWQATLCASNLPKLSAQQISPQTGARVATRTKQANTRLLPAQHLHVQPKAAASCASTAAPVLVPVPAVLAGPQPAAVPLQSAAVVACFAASARYSAAPAVQCAAPVRTAVWPVTPQPQ